MKKNGKAIRVLLVDDHPIVLEGLKSYLATHPDLEVVGFATNGAEALRQARALSPDIILLDITMPDVNGIESLLQLRKQVPAARVLVLSMHKSREYVSQSVQSGARGYVLKDSAPAELANAIKAVSRGEVYFSPAVNKIIVDEIALGNRRAAPWAAPSPLSQRERDVLSLLADGCNSKEISSRLTLSVRTVETHRERIMRKLNIHNIAGLTKFAIQKGLVKLE
ncbi:MAG TPA: response regulator transcription factor [Verrucomicrobiae bacterium]|jgi:two-component system nitrate/nitrite response regulator NarL